MSILKPRFNPIVRMNPPIKYRMVAPAQTMDKSTKHCELKVLLKNGLRASGLFHVPARTSSAIRPSDALQERKDGLLLLSDVTLYENNTSRQISAIIMPYDSISYIELPTGWATNKPVSSNLPPSEGSPVQSIPATLPPTPVPPPASTPTPRPNPLATPVPRWMPQKPPPT